MLIVCLPGPAAAAGFAPILPGRASIIAASRSNVCTIKIKKANNRF